MSNKYYRGHVAAAAPWGAWGAGHWNGAPWGAPWAGAPYAHGAYPHAAGSAAILPAHGHDG